MSITQVSTYVIEDGSITKEKLNLVSANVTAGQVLAIDASDNFYFTDRFVEEEVDDRVAALIAAGTHSNISIVYDDVANSLSFSASGAVLSVNGQTGTVVLDTDDILEGTTNLYYTSARVLGEFSASGDLSYDSANGVFSVTTYKSSDFNADFSSKTTTDLTEGTNLYYTDTRARNSISVTDAGGDGAISYNATTGVITYTGPSASEVRAHFSAGTGVSITNGSISIGQAVATTSNVTFNDMTVSGNLTVNGTTTTVNTQELQVADNIITLNSDWDANTAPTQDAGIEVNRGTEINASWTWNETGDYWTPSHKIDMGGLTVTNLATPVSNSDATTKAYVDSAVSAGTGALDTDDVAEGILNLYFTEERAQDAIGNLIVGGTNITVDYDDANSVMTITANGLTGSTTDDLTEGSTNLYYTDERVDDRVSALIVGGTAITVTYNDVANTLTIDGIEDNFANNTTDDLTEGLTNLYYTNNRATADARSAISVSGDLSYNSTTGVISFTERTDSEVRGLLSASGDLSYDSTNGIFSVTTYKSTDFDTDFSGKTTDDLSEGTTNLYYTDARARASISVTDPSGGVTYNSATGVVTIDPLTDTEIRAFFSGVDGVSYDSANGVFSLDTTYSPTFVDMTLTGNLTVQGTTTTVDTENLLVSDNIVTLNSDVTGTPTENAGIEVERGTSTNVGIRWNETVDAWQFSNDGVTYQNIGSLSASDTDDLTEGTTNLYFTDERAQDALGNIMIGGNNITFTYDDANNIMTIDGDISTTTDLPEGTNLYYTDARWDAKMTAASTDDLSEGTTNLYYTDARADARVDELRTDLTQDGNASVHFNNLTNVPIVTSQTFTGNGILTQFTLQDDPGSSDALIVTLNGVTQTPGSDYTVSGTTLTFTSALPNGQVALVRFVGYQIAGSTPTGALPLAGGTMSGSILVGADNTYDLGTTTNQWRAVYGHTIEATYADLAERYEVDSEQEVGTVVVFGGDKEITPCREEADISVAGVISTAPALKMNSNAGSDDTHPYVALRGRVPCKVIGPVRKGDLMVTSSKVGFAKSAGRNDMGHAVFAKSLVEDLTDGIKIIEVVII